MDAPDPNNPPTPLINRELSLLEFNQRVLAQAQDESVPLLERLKFLCISSSNLDEFFEIRVAGIKQLLELTAPQQPRSPDGLDPAQQLAAIHRRATQLVDDQYTCLTESLIPTLRAAGVHIVARSEWDEPMRAWLSAFFEREMEPVLTPLALDPSRPFPRIQNKSLNFIVQLQGVDAYGREADQAILQAPRSLPRVIALPDLGAAPLPDGATLEGHQTPQRFVALSGIVQEFVPRLFEGMRILGCYPFRVTRNSDLFVDEEEIDDLRHALEGELAQRRYGAAVRLETTRDCPDELVAFLLRQFSLTELDLYRVPSMVNLHRLSAVYDLVNRLDLKFPAFSPGLPKRLAGGPDLFAVIRQRDVLLHHPYQPFSPVLDFLRQAAADPQVLAIKQTLYRTGADSAVVEALVAAANSAKDVTVVIELRARFDEAENIELSNRLQEAGAHVMYGVVGYKTHAKMALVVRREADGIRRYCHLGTGNYHSRTARGYTDYGMFTCDPAIGQDVHEIFLQLTSLTRTPRLSRLLQSPFGLHAAMLGKLEREAAHALAGRPARAILKMNSLVEPQAIEALYQASRAGVRIDLVVRGICALRPGVPGLSENIRVRSIVGRFLEHSRVFCFENGGEPEVFCSSADWMERNFFRRVEIAFPIGDAELRGRILRDLETCLWDNTQAWELGPDGRYTRLQPGREPAVSAQTELLATYAAGQSPDD
ncbi:MAG: polyphosphate kinase 1 [Steroidobacteraceae bacterium]|nr:polyphosphate kinase 1 [Nevskiaceae bacterium]MCP5360306.1 polyphosphate kinase 1 [Nevskiaceae bacterium]MCP5471193.1 polyphosphate kinase 1 [Nevskiaceae bacterium]